MEFLCSKLKLRWWFLETVVPHFYLLHFPRWIWKKKEKTNTNSTKSTDVLTIWFRKCATMCILAVHFWFTQICILYSICITYILCAQMRVILHSLGMRKLYSIFFCHSCGIKTKYKLSFASIVFIWFVCNCCKKRSKNKRMNVRTNKLPFILWSWLWKIIKK